jgi:hypothetical protein
MFSTYTNTKIRRVNDIDRLIPIELLNSKKDLFNLETLKKRDLNNQVFYLKHFIDLLDMASAMTEIQSALDFDTTKSTDFFAAQQKLKKLDEAKFTGLFPEDIINKLRNESVISSFAVQGFSLDVWNKILPLRSNRMLNQYIADKLYKDVNINIRSEVSEKFARTFKNDFLMYLLQNKGLSKQWRKDNGVLWKRLFFGDTAVANQLKFIKSEYKDELKKYSLVDALTKSISKVSKIVNIRLNRVRLDTAMINNFYEQFEKLTNIDVKKSEDPAKNKEITEFFKKVALAGILQSGLNKSYLSFTEIIPENLWSNLMLKTIKENSVNIKKRELDDFYRKFRLINRDLFGGRGSADKNRLKNYTSQMYGSDNTYKGSLTAETLPDNGVFVFGSNPVGINGNLKNGTGGGALAAQKYFGVKQGEIMDNTISQPGRAYGLTTVKQPGAKKSLTREQIIENISKLYNYALLNPEKDFYIGYNGTKPDVVNLNGYTSAEMAEMFRNAGDIPANIVFEENFKNLVVPEEVDENSYY